MTAAQMIAELRVRGQTCVQIGKSLQVSALTVRRWANGEFDPRYQQGKALEGLYESVIAQVKEENVAVQEKG